MGLFIKIQAKHNLILKLVLVMIVSVVFASLLPTEQVNFHSVDEFDAVWPYKDLVVEEDFFMKKSPAQIKEEQKKILESAPLIFSKNTDEMVEKSKEFALVQSTNPNIYHLLKPIFDSIYKVGVIQSVNDAKEKIVLVNDNSIGESAAYDSFFTIQTASDFISKELNKTSGDGGFNYADYLAITLFFDSDKTEGYKRSLIDNFSIYKGIFQKGEKVVSQGQQLTKEKRGIINDYFRLRKNANHISFYAMVGRTGLMFLLNITLLMYLFFFRKSIFGQNLQVLFLYLCLFVAFVTHYFFFKYGLMITALPFVLIPIIVRAFFDSRTALFTHLIAVLVCSFFMPDKIEFMMMQLVTGIGILFSISEMRKRQQIINAAIISVLFYCIIFLFYNLGFGTKALLTKFSAYLPYLISGSLVLLATPLIFISEKLFGFMSDFKLLELCDLNQPLLRDLSQQIPGTFQHSMQVANLAEEAIYFIGGNTLLVRAGAMYHDVGKIFNPSYFTENQGGNASPHIVMQPKESAKIIINHVIQGIELAKKHHLPEQIIDFIRTHHGQRPLAFF